MVRPQMRPSRSRHLAIACSNVNGCSNSYMLQSIKLSRRTFLRSASMAAAAAKLPGCSLPRKPSETTQGKPLAQFEYGDVQLESEPHERQLQQTQALLMGLNEDSMLKPLRQMSGLPAPGEDLGGWYHYNPDYVWGR